MRRQAEGGFSLIQVLIGLAVLSIGVLSLLSVFPGLAQLTRTSRENQIALSAMRSQLEAMRALPFPDQDDPGNTDNMFDVYDGATFTVEGLAPPAPNEPHGTVTFLTEAEAADAFDMDFDLDLNRKVNETEPPNRFFVVYPVRLTIRWREGARIQESNLTTMLYNKHR